MRRMTRPSSHLGVFILMGFAVACSTEPIPEADAPQTAEPVAPLMTDDHSVYIDRPADQVWAHIKRLYVDGDRYAGYGNEIVDIGDDPSAFLGGYLAIETPEDGERLERGVFRFSDLDEEKRFLAMSVVTPDTSVRNLVVMHRVEEAGDGAEYSVIIQANLILDDSGSALTQAEVAAEMKARTDAHHEGLQEIMNAVKAEIEG